MVTKILMPITNGLHHFFRLSCFNFALISPQMATNTKPNIRRRTIIVSAIPQLFGNIHNLSA